LAAACASSTGVKVKHYRKVASPAPVTGAVRLFPMMRPNCPIPAHPELVEGLSFFYTARMTFWTYMLHCRGGAFYVGHTDNLEYRIGQHQSGLIAGFTADHLPVTLVWSQDFLTRHEAKEAEKGIKGWSRAKKMALIRGDWERISILAKGKNGPSTSSGRTGLKEPVTETANPSPDPARPELVEGLSLSLNS
jgi:predicted GIY-YIG superfamily endonuclease